MGVRPLLLSIAGVTLLLATGCRTVTGGSCHKPQEYQQAGNLPPLKAPAGLDGPDTSGAMEIPELNQPEAPVDPDGPCLDAPPALTEPPPPLSDIEVPLPPTRRPASAAPRAEGSDSGESGETRERRRPSPRPPR